MLSEIGYLKSCAKETVKWFRRELGTISCGMISSISDEVCMLAASIYILARACLIRPKPLGAHITSDFSHKILIQHSALIQNILNGSPQNCAHSCRGMCKNLWRSGGPEQNCKTFCFHWIWFVHGISLVGWIPGQPQHNMGGISSYPAADDKLGSKYAIIYLPMDHFNKNLTNTF